MSLKVKTLLTWVNDEFQHVQIVTKSSGGIRLAYVGYKAHLKEYGEKFSPEEFERYFPGFSNDQLFFISFAQLWCDAASMRLFFMV
jgi:predicted metalloendopeptidase